MVKHYFSESRNYWKTGTAGCEAGEDTLELTGVKKQEITGFGGCFNEIAWNCLQKAEINDRDSFFDELFSENGCDFNLCRVPIGANDFSLDWYSCDETEGDFELTDFNINRDKAYTIPYIKEALKRQKDMRIFASPWSPPTWMKTKKVYNYGVLKKDEATRKAYAQYFIKFVEAYRKEGIPVRQIHVQNEPFADQKFPSCMWTGTELRDFIKCYLGPAVEKSGIDAEIWLGTINGPFIDFMMGGGAPFSEYYDQFENTILSDKEARKYISGVGFQWGGKHSIAQTVLSYPELHYMQTESECGDGQNSWEHAEYVYGLMWHYFYNQAESYIYWNMALPEGGISTWGWPQNSLVTVNEDTGEVTYQPEFYVMKHLSHFVKRGARVLETKGRWASNCIVFENPDGQLVILAGSNMGSGRKFRFEDGNRSFSADIGSHSIHTFII